MESKENLAAEGLNHRKMKLFSLNKSDILCYDL